MTVTAWPARRASHAIPRPMIPPPMTATSVVKISGATALTVLPSLRRHDPDQVLAPRVGRQSVGAVGALSASFPGSRGTALVYEI